MLRGRHMCHDIHEIVPIVIQDHKGTLRTAAHTLNINSTFFRPTAERQKTLLGDIEVVAIGI
jgi:hypothetical protein